MVLCNTPDKVRVALATGRFPVRRGMRPIPKATMSHLRPQEKLVREARSQLYSGNYTVAARTLYQARLIGELDAELTLLAEPIDRKIAELRWPIDFGECPICGGEYHHTGACPEREDAR